MLRGYALLQKVWQTLKLIWARLKPVFSIEGVLALQAGGQHRSVVITSITGPLANQGTLVATVAKVADVVAALDRVITSSTRPLPAPWVIIAVVTGATRE